MKIKIGEKLRSVREKKQLTLKDIAGQANLSESLISQIERNKVSPALDTLLKISEILEIDLEYLFQDYKTKKTVNIIRKNKRHKVIKNGVTFEQISKTVASEKDHNIEAFYLEVDSNHEKGSYDYGHNGRELGLILEGTGEFLFGNESYVLKKGDSVSFEANIPHILKNTGKNKLKAFWVITPPKNFF